MARPTLKDTLEFMTTSEAATRLGIPRRTLKQWVRREVLPAPTKISTTGIRLFDDEWIAEARQVVARMNRMITPQEFTKKLEELNEPDDRNGDSDGGAFSGRVPEENFSGESTATLSEEDQEVPVTSSPGSSPG